MSKKENGRCNKKIYLTDDVEWDTVWSPNQIEDDDIEYIRADVVKAERDELLAALLDVTDSLQAAKHYGAFEYDDESLCGKGVAKARALIKRMKP